MAFIPYVNRSYLQIKEYVLTRIFGERDSNGQFVAGGGLLPEMTDHSENNIIVRIISVWAGIAEMLNYYIDSSAKETFLKTCRRYKSAVMIARFYDYRVKCSTAATVDLMFYVDNAATSVIDILAGTECQTADGLIFLTTAAAQINVSEKSVVVSARQVNFSAWVQLGVSDGTANQEFELPSQTAYGSVSIKVDGNTYQSVDTFAFSKASDRVFIETVNYSGVPIVMFSDGFFGVKPQANAVVSIKYGVTEGLNGNVAQSTITTINNTSNGSLKVINVNSASGGTGIETLYRLKYRIPLSNKTVRVANRKQDYIDIAQLHPSVSRAGVETNCGAAVKVYIVPIGGGIASIQLQNDVRDYFEDKRLYGRQIEVLPTGEVKVKLKIKVRTRVDFERQTVFDLVSQRLQIFLSYLNQNIGGSVELSDIYEIIESTEGVLNSRVTTMTTTPFARWSIMGQAWKNLDWTVSTNEASSDTVQWSIEFISPSVFQLMKNSEYVGSFNVGDSVLFSEVIFTVNTDHSTGDVWRFTTYKYFGSIELNEQSLPVSYSSDITIEPL